MMEIRQLQCFIAVAEDLHFRAAAERLHIAQPHLSRLIRRLEDELGASLFDRTSRRVRLTEAGRALLGEARAIVAHVERAVQAAQRADRGELGALVIGYVGAATHEVLPVALREFTAAWPSVEIVLHELTTVEQIAAMRNGQIQIGFARPPIDDRTLVSECIARDRLIVALPETHHLSEQPTVSLCALTDEPFICSPRSSVPGLYDLVVKACGQAGFVPRMVQQTVEIHTMLSLVAAGIGVALLPASVQQLARAGVVYRTLDHHPIPIIDFVMFWRRDDSSPILRSFVQTVHKLTAGLPLGTRVG